MNLSERLCVDKKLFSGERRSYENIRFEFLFYIITEKNRNVSVDSSLYYGENA